MSKYETHIEPYFDLLTKWLSNGATEKQCAENPGVAYSTFRRFKKEKKALSALIRDAKRNVVTDLRGALIKRALGFEYTETKKTYIKADLPDKTVEALKEIGYTEEDIAATRLVKEEVSKKVSLPDINAINLALKNYDKNAWANDPQMLDIKKKELKLKEKVIENSNW